MSAIAYRMSLMFRMLMLTPPSSASVERVLRENARPVIVDVGDQLVRVKGFLGLGSLVSCLPVGLASMFLQLRVQGPLVALGEGQLGRQIRELLDGLREPERDLELGWSAAATDRPC